MLISSCPRCDDDIRTPTNAHQEAIVRCPRCLETFPLSEIYNKFPPELEIVSEPASALKPSTAGVSLGYDLTEDEGEDDFQFKPEHPPSVATQPISNEGAAPMARLERERARRSPSRREPNVAMEFVKIVLGGVAGLAIAVMAIMWFGNQDVFKIVPKMPVQLYFLVPAELQTGAMKEYAASGAEPADAEPTDPQVRVDPEVPSESFATAKPRLDPQDGSNPASENSIASAFEKSKQRSQSEKTNKTPKPTTNPGNQPKLQDPEPMAEREAEKPIEPEKPASKPEPRPEPTEPSPIPDDLLEKINAASDELGEIGIGLPEKPEPMPVEALEENDIDLSPPEED